MRSLNLIVIHHSASPRTTRFADVERWHKDKGWHAIGYHLLIEGDGTVQRGRPLDETGAHAKGANTDSIGVCTVGDNTDPAERWAPVQEDALVRTVRALRLLLGPLEVVRHCDVGTTATECPGLDEGTWAALLTRMTA